MSLLLALSLLSGHSIPAPRILEQKPQRTDCRPEIIAIGDADLRRDAAYFRNNNPVLDCVSQASVNWAARHHKSSVVRTAAIQQRALDQSLLAEIALQDGDRDVRVEAIKKLEDQQVLAKIALSKAHSDVRVEAVLRLKDQGALERIVLDGRDEYIVRWNALRVIESDRVLAKVLSEKSSLMEGVDLVLVDRKVAKVRDQEALRQMVWESAYLGVRTAAVWNLTDQRMLADVVLKHPEVNIQVHAVQRMTDQAVLARVALEHPSESVRRYAIERLEDQPALSKVALTDMDYGVRLTAARRVTDQAVLLTLIKDADAEMRKRAATNLDDEQELRRLVENDIRDVALVAVGRVKNQELLLRWAQWHPLGDIRWQAIQKLGPEFDRDGLTRAALDDVRSEFIAEAILRGSSPKVRRDAINSSSPEVRVEVLQTIAEFKETLPRELVMRIAFEDSSPYVRRQALTVMNDADADAHARAAVEDASPIVREFAATRFPRNHPVRIRTVLNDADSALRRRLVSLVDDPLALKQIIEESKDPKVRQIAIGRIVDREFVGLLIANDPDPEIREAAAKRLKALARK